MVYTIPIFCEQGGDKFHILLKGNACEIDYEACFQNCGTVEVKQILNPCTLTGCTPSKSCIVNFYVFSSNLGFCSHVE